MTTEILRSMLYNGSDIVRELEWVVFDEVHYINDRERGVVWEEILILLPDHVGVVLLSATVPNAYELAEWIGRIKKREIFVVSTDKRPVPLEHYLWTNTSTQFVKGAKKTAGEDCFLIVDSKSNFLAHNYKNACEAKKKDKEVPQKPGNKNQGQQQKPPPVKKHVRGGNPFNLSQKEEKLLYTNLVRALEAKDKLPVIVFTLSRARCDGNAANMPHTLDLLTAVESKESLRFFRACIARLKGSDKRLPQILVMEDLLKRGIGIHHSGILPILKEVVELLFAKGTCQISM
jgi:antiviral helicase SKI2